MQRTKIGSKTFVLLAATALVGVSASAEVLYDNSANFLLYSTPEVNQEIGDYVIFGGTSRVLTDFQFEFFVSPTANKNETFEAFIYANNAPANMPGTLLYDSGTHPLTPGTPNGFGTVHIQGLSLTVPNSITWTVKFGGVDAGEQAGLLFYNPPSTGTSPTFDPATGTIDSSSVPGHKDFTVLHTGSGFQLVDHSGLNGGTLVDNLGARFTSVPEPGTWALLAGGLTLFALRRRKA